MRSAVMSRQEAIEGRKTMKAHARTLAVITCNAGFRFGVRYEAAVMCEHCLDVARAYNEYLRDFCQEG